MLNSVNPFVLAAVIGGVIALVSFAVAWLARGSSLKGIMIILALICLLPAGYLFLGLNPWLVDSRFRTYRAFYRDIDVGMTREQVLAAMEQRYPAGGPRKRPRIMDDTPERLGFFMNPGTSREPNCEGIFLTLERGRVTRIEYSPD